MSRGIIAHYKIGKTADIMAKKFDVEIKKTEDDVRKLLTDFFISKSPFEIVEFFKNYPYMVKMQGNYSAQIKGRYVYFKIDAPWVGSVDDVIDSDPGFKKKLKKMVAKVDTASKKKLEMRGKIKCVMTSLKSYKALQADFPEAYTVLVEKVDGEVVIKDNLCDSVENLRAELSKKETK